MATAQYVSELAQGTKVDGAYVLRAKELRIARTGDAYLALVLADRTGSVPAVLFRPTRSAVEIPAAAVVRVLGTVTAFKGTRRVMVDKLAPAETWDPSDLVATTNRSTDELVSEFSALVKQVNDARIRQLLRSIFGDKALFATFLRCPATQSEHHCHVGGLLEHTVAVAQLCAQLSEHYDSLDRDLLLSSALLHDIGVIDALRFDTGIALTDQGRLMGHAVLGGHRIYEAARRIRLDEGRSSRLQHAVISHHDDQRLGMGALTLEAVALGNADRMDAQLTGFTHVLDGAVRADEKWTDDQNQFGRSLFAPSACRGAGGSPVCTADEVEQRSA